MITTVLGVYSKLLSYYRKKWSDEKIDRKFLDWEEGQELRKDMGFDDRTVKRIPKRKIKNNRARKRNDVM